MHIRLNRDVIKEANEAYFELRKKETLLKEDVLQLNVQDFMDTAVFKKDHFICHLEEIEEMIHGLTLMKQAIEETTGLVIERM